MADKRLDSLLAEAQMAYQKRDRHAGAQLIDEILKQDFNHPGAWQLLYRLYGAGRPFEDFRRVFSEQYYPDDAHLLRAIIPTAGAGDAPPKKPSFFARLFSRFSRTTDQEKQAQRQPVPPPGPAEREPVRPSVEKALAAPPRPATSSQGQIEQPRAEPASLLQSARPRAEPASRPGPVSQRSPMIPASRPIPGATAAPAVGRKLRVIVVDDIAETRENVVRSLSFHEEIEVVGTAHNGGQGIELAKEEEPDVVLMDVNMPDMDGIEATRAIRRLVPFTQVVILTVQDDVDYIRKAMLAGARDYLTKPPMIDELVTAVQRAGAVAQQERAKAPPIVPALQGPQAYAARGKIITVYSPRGGAGCTMFAANLAATLHEEESQVVLVDGNLQFGDVPVFYNLHSRYSIRDLAPRSEELDSELVESVLIQHSSGVRLLAPTRPEEAENVSGAQFSHILTYLSELYPYVVVDTAHRLTNITLTALDHSDLIVLLTAQDIPSIARVRKFLDLIPLLNIDTRNILIAMNQFDKRVGVTPDKVEQAFHLKITAVLPMDNQVVMPSINRGVPFMLQKELHSRPIAQAVLETTETIRQRIAQLEQEMAEAG